MIPGEAAAADHSIGGVSGRHALRSSIVVKALGDTLAPRDVILAASCANMPNGSTNCQNYFLCLSVLAPISAPYPLQDARDWKAPNRERDVRHGRKQDKRDRVSHDTIAKQEPGPIAVINQTRLGTPLGISVAAIATAPAAWVPEEAIFSPVRCG